MLAAKLLTTQSKFAVGKIFTRSARTQARGRFSTAKSRLSRPVGRTAFTVGHYVALGGGAAGIGGLIYYGLRTQGAEATGFQRMALWTETIRSRVRTTYGYLGGSIGAAVGSAYFACRSPTIMRLLSRGGFMPLIISFGALLGTSILARSIPYKEGFGMKQVAWLGFCGTLGAIMAPLSFVGGQILYRAALYTAGIVGGLSAVAISAPSEEFLKMGGLLGAGLGFLMVSAIGSVFLGPATAVGSVMHAFMLYGGLVIFGGFTLYDTQRVVKAAETHPVYSQRPFDPVNHSMDLFMNIANIFMRLVIIMSGGGKKR